MATQNPQHPSWEKPRTAEGSSSLAERAEKAAEQVSGSAIERVQQAQSGMSQQRDQLAERIRRVGGVLRESGDQLRKEDEFVAEYLNAASKRVERVASYVTTADFSSVASDVQGFVRQRPALFFGGAFLVGLAAGRFLKASAASSQQSYGAEGGEYGARGYGNASTGRSQSWSSTPMSGSPGAYPSARSNVPGSSYSGSGATPGSSYSGSSAQGSSYTGSSTQGSTYPGASTPSSSSSTQTQRTGGVPSSTPASTPASISSASPSPSARPATPAASSPSGNGNGSKSERSDTKPGTGTRTP